jgi:hypothetical protein
MNCSGGSDAKRRLKCWMKTRSMPAAASASILSRRLATRARRREQLARMRLERHHRRAQAVPTRGGNQLRQQRLVPAVNAVEIANRQRHRHAIAAARDAAKDLHCSRERRAGGLYEPLLGQGIVTQRRQWARA